jgi:large subunit ribosomal protein L35
MPKLKVHSATSKRIKVTRNNKVLVRKAYGNHFLEKKSKGRKRTYQGYKSLAGKFKRTIKRKVGK